MIAFPFAKINLGLHIIEKRPDHYHNIETIFYPVEWCDILEIIKADDFAFFHTGLPVAGNANDNLCVKAYNLLKSDWNISPVHIYLHKIIPIGAGLGGGSSDAAHTLLLLNKIFALNLSLKQLSEYAVKLGSDCAFFLQPHPMFAQGRGELLSAIDVSLKKYFIVMVMPQVQVNTSDAYQWIIPAKPKTGLERILKLPIEEWKNVLENDFEKPVFEKYPLLKEIKEQLYLQGALYSAMSGSGASVFGIFKREINFKNVFKDCVVWQDNARY